VTDIASSYRRILGYRSYRRFWLGFTFSALGDAKTRVALIWFVFEATGSPLALGLLSLCYTGPVLIGGLVAGWLLDRFDRRRVMMADSLIRGASVATIPILQALGRLALWQLYAVAAVYGPLMMISLAGGPSLVPSLVPRAQLVTANALEVLGFTVGAVLGPPAAGLLIAALGAPSVLIVDAFSYAAFAAALLGVRLRADEPAATTATARYRLRDAVHLLLTSPILLTTTLMFMAYNLGLGFLLVWLPILAERSLGGGAPIFGSLLGAFAVGELTSSLLAGTVRLPYPLGLLIGIAQGLAGLCILPLFWNDTWVALVALLAVGFFSAPLTIWAQTLRMDIIPEPLRGRAFALLRMLMQGAGPLGGMLAGLLLPILGLGVTIGATAAVVGLPGAVVTRVGAMRASRRAAVDAPLMASDADPEPSPTF
jgi:MFS family permease